MNIFQLSQGHAINAYKKILENIRDKDINISFKWIAPSNNEVHIKR